MTDLKTKYFFRKKTRDNFTEENKTLNISCSSSSAESDDVIRIKDDPRTVTLHVITDPGQSEPTKSSFQSLIARLDSHLDVICVSERFKALQVNSPQRQANKASMPSLAVLLFFKEEFELENAVGNLENGSNLSEKLFIQKSWKFHHNVDVSGKLISCETNRQDYYDYAPECFQKNGPKFSFPKNPDPKTETSIKQYHFPLWGVRKVHYGNQILRFTVFTSICNWKDQINFYKLILRKEETVVRDDFCFFEVFSNGNTAIQLGLKKLPASVSPEPLISSILQFKVKNVGQLVPVLPNICDPISEFRWRTRDYDGNVVLFQIRPARGFNIGSSFVKKIFSDHDSSLSSDGRKTPDRKKPRTPNGRRLPQSSKSKLTDNPHPLASGHKESVKNEQKLILSQRSKEHSGPDLGDSFVCPSLPEKMPLLDRTLYFQTNSQRSSRSSSTSSTSEYQSARGTSPDIRRAATPIRGGKTDKNPPDAITPTPVPEALTRKNEKTSPNPQLLLSLTSNEGFYV